MYRPNPAGPRTLRALYHWVFKSLTDVGKLVGGDLPTDPPSPVPPPVPGAHSHYIELLINVGAPNAVLRDMLDYNPVTGLWEKARRTRYIPGGYVAGSSYQRGDEVSNGSQISEAVIDGATESPFIEPTGSPFLVYTGTGMADVTATGKQVLIGDRYTFDIGGYLTGYTLKNALAGQTYEIYTVVDPLGARTVKQIATFTPEADGDIVVPITPYAVYAGTTFDLLYLVDDTAAAITQTVANYRYTTPNNANNPNNGDIEHGNNNPGRLFIDLTDDDGIDRSTFLRTLTTGDRIAILDMAWTIDSIIDQGDHLEVLITPTTQAGSDGVTAVTFTQVTQSPIATMRETDYWLNTAFPNGSAQGLYGIDTPHANIVPDNAASNILLEVQHAYIPVEWQVKVIT